VWKLLHGDRVTLGLLGNDPFPDKPPRFIRAKLYRYRFARHGESGYWHREMLGLWLTPLSVDDARLQRFLSAYGWLGAAPATEDDPPR
jgi:hypothetical protein